MVGYRDRSRRGNDNGRLMLFGRGISSVGSPAVRPATAAEAIIIMSSMSVKPTPSVGIMYLLSVKPTPSVGKLELDCDD